MSVRIATGTMGVVLGVLLVHGCGDDGDPRDVPADEVFVHCTEDLCTAGNLICCAGSRPGTWDSMRLGCICPSTADADADGDDDAAPDVPEVEPGDVPDVEPDVVPDVEPGDAPEVEPGDVPDVEPDVVPDVEPDLGPDSPG